MPSYCSSSEAKRGHLESRRHTSLGFRDISLQVDSSGVIQTLHDRELLEQGETWEGPKSFGFLLCFRKRKWAMFSILHGKTGCKFIASK